MYVLPTGLNPVAKIETCVRVFSCQPGVREMLQVSCVGMCDYRDKVEVRGCWLKV